MADIKTVATKVDVETFIEGVEHEGRREDARELLALMTKWTGWEARMWGPSIIGFGKYDYTYDSGHSGSMCVVGFSPRKANLVVYVDRSYDESDALVETLGKVKVSTGCLYLGRLSTVDVKVLEKLVKQGVKATKKRWGVSAG
jgi:hypothetical protein